tara:strand:+ start:35 stop:454 length:420 start_codon:yes stop_codon:yes gene_type:complete
MKIIPIALIIILTTTSSHGQNSPNVFKALRFKSELGLQRPYRVLKTTCKNLDQFQVYYRETEISLDQLLRFHLYTEIQINQQENKLISMDQTEFQLKKTESAETITKEVVELISKMYFGSNEVKKFLKKNKQNYQNSKN